MSNLSVVLPPYIVLKSSDNKYLVNDSHQLPQPDNKLVCTGEDIFSKYAKLEVVSASVGEGRVVHLKCCYNKKYLRVFSQSNSYIYALADEPEEDTGSWACTLFEPLSVEANNSKKIRLRHVKRGNYACYWKTSEARRGLVTDYSVHDHQGCDIYTVTDWESLVVLPKHVAFKGDNGNYMSVRHKKGWLHWHVMFDSIDKGNPAAWFEVTTTPDGYAQIRSHAADDNLLLWTGLPEKSTYIKGYDEDASKRSQQSLFWPVKIDNKNTVALRSALNNKICTRVSESDGDYFHALHPTIVAASHLKVEELVLNRRIYNAVFHLDQAVIYGQTSISMATARNINNGTADNTVAIPLSYTQSQSRTWKFAQSTTEGISAGINIGIPEIEFGGEISVSRQTTQSYEWGSTSTDENKIATTYTVLVPPGESVSVSLLATKGYCDVPFSYFQRDLLYTGETVIYKKDDGLFTGVNTYDFRLEVISEAFETTPQASRIIIS